METENIVYFQRKNDTDYRVEFEMEFRIPAYVEDPFQTPSVHFDLQHELEQFVIAYIRTNYGITAE